MSFMDMLILWEKEGFILALCGVCIYVRHGFKKLNKHIFKTEERFGGQSNCLLRWDSHLNLGELGQ